MWMDLKKFKWEYDKYTLKQKVETVSTMLEWLLWKWENFDKIYDFLKNYPDLIVESEVDEVFAILLLWLYEDQQDKLKETEGKLDSIMWKMKSMRQQEQMEREEPEDVLKNL